jgi:hypothetical protein
LEIHELDKLVDNEYAYGAHGHFLMRFMLAWKTADPSNKGLLKPVMEALVKKYDFPTKIMEFNEERELRTPEQDYSFWEGSNHIVVYLRKDDFRITGDGLQATHFHYNAREAQECDEGKRV